MATPRTWTLLGEHGASTVLGEKLPPFHRIVVVEAEPVLDLLEAQVEFLESVTQWTGSDPDEIHERIGELQKVLGEHGRLS